MRSPTFGIPCVVLVLACMGCQPSESAVSQEDLDTAEAEVASVLQAFWADWAAADFQEGMAYYSDDPHMAFITDGFAWESKAAVDDAYRSFFGSLQSQEVNLTSTDIHALTPHVVQVIQTARYTQTSRSGDVSPERRFAASFVWVREGGEWKVMAFHQSEPGTPTAGIKTVHLLNTPSPADEAAYTEAVAELNRAIREAGYPGNGYTMWTVSDSQDPDATTVGYGLLLEGIWTDQETYDAIHELEAYESFDQEALDLFERVSVGERYTRYERVEVGGPGEG